jgi:4-alpha-glucanotransferase
MQDLLGLGASARMNIPGAIVDQWAWKLPQGSLSIALADQIRERLDHAERLVTKL